VIRADATPASGAGHVMRCGNLAHAWMASGNGPAHFVGRIVLDFVAQRLREIGATFDELPEGLGPDDVWVVDSYDPVVRATAETRAAGLSVLVDDMGDNAPPAVDVVWNPNAYGSPDLYPMYGGTVLTGDRCVPIRADLPAWSADGSRGIAVALGGSALADNVRDTLAAGVDDASREPIWSYRGLGKPAACCGASCRPTLAQIEKRSISCRGSIE
jgi:spore coat polysaccharide biosynthesis predicted glycosyltransferase SpsG